VKYRLLTADEIIQLGQELERYRRWEQVREYVLTLYGPAAYEVTISVYSRYNDENYDQEANIIVTNQAGEPISFDFSLPWWSAFDLAAEDVKTFLDNDEGDLSDAYDLGGQVHRALEDYCREKIGIELLEDVGDHDHRRELKHNEYLNGG
jgi:hypothetical protein